MEFEEADVEPGAEPRLEFAVERRQFRIVVEEAQQVGAQVDEEFHARGQGVELGEDADARRTHRRAQVGLGVPLCRRADRRLPGGVRRGDGLRLGAELERDDAQELAAAGIVEAQVGLAEPRRAVARRDFAAVALRAVGQLLVDARAHAHVERRSRRRRRAERTAPDEVIHGILPFACVHDGTWRAARSSARRQGNSQGTSVATSSSGQRTAPLITSAVATDRPSENTASRRPMLFSMTAKVDTQGT